MTAYGYVRKSVMHEGDTTLSPAVQRERVEALAASHGDKHITILEDLDISGAKVDDRPDYLQLVAAIESGDAHAVYAYDLSRLHRNTKEALRFFELAKDHGTSVRLVADNIDTSTASGTMMLTILAAMNAWTSQVTSEKIRATFALKRSRHEPLGGRNYGEREGDDPRAVVDAYRGTRSAHSTARALTAANVPTRNGKSRGWSTSAVLNVVGRLAPDALREDGYVHTARGWRRSEETNHRGSSGSPRSFRFARLLRCGVCGTILTPHIDSKRQGIVRYQCHTSRSHVRRSVTESAVIATIMDEFEHARPFVSRKAGSNVADYEAKRDAIASERERVKAMFRKGHMEEPEYDSVMDELAADETKLVMIRPRLRVEIPPDLATDDPTRVNSYLRRVFDRVTLDMSAPPHYGVHVADEKIAATFAWRDPSLRLEVVDEDDPS